MTQKTRLTFLGGLDTIGKNMLVLEHRNNAVIIDCGMTFPSEEMLGVNLVIPNFDFVHKIRNKIKAVIITHGHEDHIGALDHLYREINPPLYATKLTLAFAQAKFSGKQKKALLSKEMLPGQKYTFGDIILEPFRVCHSVPDGVGLIITTPDCRIVHSGDFKIEDKPLDGKPTDLDRLRKLKDVDLLLCDSTNADQPGRTLGEAAVVKTFDKLFAKTKGRIVVASFSSNIYRIQEIINVAAKHNRRVAILGRNMLANFQIAREQGFIKCTDQQIFDIEQLGTIPDHKVVILTTGSQGERMSALTHMAKRIYEKMHLKREDTVIISASPIPGNEHNINETVNNLYKLGVTLYYNETDEIHASGHACAEEIKMIVKAVQPKYFIPVHGEYKHLLIATQLAEAVGIRKNHTLICQNGDQIELDKHALHKTGHLNGTTALIDGNYLAQPGDVMFDERYQLSRKGILVITCLPEKEAIIKGYGCLYTREIETFIPILKDLLKKQRQKYSEQNLTEKDLEQRLRKDVEHLLYDKLHRRPKVILNAVA